MEAQQPAVMEGYLLKKKRKKMQGMARRYFRLSPTGALSYAFNPNSQVRDSILVSLAFISASRKSRTLAIDSGNTVWHCKALTLEDFDRWAAALKRFINIAQDQAGISQPHDLPGGGFAGGNVQHSPELGGPGASVSGTGQAELQRVNEALGKMAQPIRDLELVAQELQHSSAQLHVPSPPQRSGSFSNNGNGGNGASKFRGFLGKRSNSTSLPPGAPHPVNAARSPSFSGASTASGSTLAPPTLPPIPGITHTASDSQQFPSAFSPTSPDSSYFDARATNSPSPSNELLLRQLHATIATLKQSHEELASAVQALPRPSPFSHPYHGFDRPSSPLLSGSGGGGYHARSPSGLGFVPGHRQAPSRASSSRASFSSFFSATEGDGEWADAPLPGEFVLAEEDEGRARREGSPSSSGSSEDGRVAHGAAASEGGSTFVGEQSEGEDTDDGGEETEEEEFHDGESDRATISGTESAATGSSTAVGSVLEAGKTVQRRTALPSTVAGEEFSMLGMLRKNVGKDLSTISVPVSANEPLSALERLAEELEYSELLDRAAAAKDPLERLTLVAVFAVSAMSGNKYRSSRKPFNPLLGETYECIRPEQGFQFVSEKVSHNPPILAFHSEAPQRGWSVFGHVAPSSKFWGRSMEVFVHGDYFVQFADTGETFSIRKPSSFVRNLVAGTKYLEVVGDMVVTTSASSAQVVVSFKEGSTWGGSSTRNKIEGKVTDEHGRVVTELVGRWDDAVDKKVGKTSFERLWQIGEFPPDPERYYGFSRFAMTLNELTPLEDGRLAPTDSRLRPDQLAFERGDVDEAERLKALVEEKQRAKRREGKAGEPLWFRKEGEGWTYGGKYFEAREKQAFPDPDIFV
ncbi:hypothetical protein JCM10207_007793 [Rhodosporidiobolus poonsookiae]